MNFYAFHIGDYAAHTAHLEPMEDLAYRRMLDLYYRTEKPLPASVEDIARLIRMRDHQAAIHDVLNEFFARGEEGWRHGRCDEEILRSQDKRSKAAASAGKRWQSGRSADAMRTHCEGNAPNPNPNPNPNPKEIHTPRASAAARACVVMKREGLSDVNPGHPTLLALVEAGASEAEFAGAAQSALARSKGFAYAIGALKRQREDAARLTLHQGSLPNRDPPEPEWVREKRERVAEFAGPAAAKKTKPLEVIDADTRRLG